MVTTIIIVTQNENKILPNTIPRKIIGGRTQIYECFKFNERKGEAQHNKNYNGEIITTLPKKWIKDHKKQKCDMTTHYDMIVKPIFKTTIIPPNKPLWLLTLYLTHQEKNYL
jgi:hypothetical protein